MTPFVPLRPTLLFAFGITVLVGAFAATSHGADGPDDGVPARLARMEDDRPRRRMPMADGLAPQEAAKAMSAPPGFSVKLLAAEPDVCQPIAMCFDDRGRLWVAECYAYPRKVAAEDARDRILIFEDTDGDHAFDSRKVFKDGLNLVSGLSVGFGGVWVGAAPELLFIPDANGDDVPDGDPKVLLDGWARRTPTRRSTPSSGGPMAGFTAATACSRTPPSASRARQKPSERGSTPASGGTIRCGMPSKSFPKARAIHGVWISTTSAMRSRRHA